MTDFENFPRSEYVFQVLRKILGSGRTLAGVSQRSDLYSSLNIIRVSKSRRMKGVMQGVWGRTEM
jgi:hypothetical protein